MAYTLCQIGVLVLIHTFTFKVKGGHLFGGGLFSGATVGVNFDAQKPQREGCCRCRAIFIMGSIT